MEKQKSYKEAPTNKQFGTKLCPGCLWASAVEYLTPAGTELPCSMPCSQLEDVHCQRPHGTEDVVFNCKITRGGKGREGFSGCYFFRHHWKKKSMHFSFTSWAPALGKSNTNPETNVHKIVTKCPDISKPLSLLCCDTSKKQQNPLQDHGASYF